MSQTLFYSTFHTPPPGTEIISKGTVCAGDWFFVDQLRAWGQVPKIGYGEGVATCGHLVARPIPAKDSLEQKSLSFGTN